LKEERDGGRLGIAIIQQTPSALKNKTWGGENRRRHPLGSEKEKKGKKKGQKGE